MLIRRQRQIKSMQCVSVYSRRAWTCVCAATEFFVRLAVCMLDTARVCKSLIGRGMRSYVILGALVVQKVDVLRSPQLKVRNSWFEGGVYVVIDLPWSVRNSTDSLTDNCRRLAVSSVIKYNSDPESNNACTNWNWPVPSLICITAVGMRLFLTVRARREACGAPDWRAAAWLRCETVERPSIDALWSCLVENSCRRVWCDVWHTL